MQVLICGANGFIGRHLAEALAAAGHAVTRGVRAPVEATDVGIDYRRDTAPGVWASRLAGVDAVINAVGVLRDSPGSPMRSLHVQAPSALLAACVNAGVSRFVQISALGVGGALRTHYFDTKAAADACLQACSPPLTSLILRPSLVYGADGASTRLLCAMAGMPVHLLPSGGKQRLRPVHVDDLAMATVRWLGDPDAACTTVAAVGRDETTLRGLLDSYRAQSGRGRAWHVRIPRRLVRCAARLGDRIPASLLCSETLAMLEAGNSADAGAFTRLLGHPPRSCHDFVHNAARAGG